MEKRTLKIKGTGRVLQKPDQIAISFDINSKQSKYSQCLKDLKEKTTLLRENIKGAGLPPENLKTGKLEVDSDYKWNGKNNVFNGYKGTHCLSIEFDLDKDLLNKVLDNINESLANTEFKIHFQVKDQEALKAKILESAVTDAKRSAKIISDAAGIKLGKIKEIVYSWAEIYFRSDLDIQKNSFVMADETPQFDIEPDDIDAQDTISIEWEIE